LVAAVGELDRIDPASIEGLLGEAPAWRRSITAQPRRILLRPWGEDLDRARSSLDQAIADADSTDGPSGVPRVHSERETEARRTLQRWRTMLRRSTADSLIGELACREIRRQVAQRRRAGR
jgi:hypothetical protein